VQLFLYYNTKQSLTSLEIIINPFNVVRFLLAFISSIYLIETSVTEAEKENIQKLLKNIFHYNELEVTEETSNLDDQEPYKLRSLEIIKDDEDAWSEDNLNSPQYSNDDADSV